MINKKLPVYLAILGAVLISVIIIAAVADQSQHTARASKHTNISSTSTSKLSNLKVGPFIGNIAPDFVLQTINGEEIKLSDFRGKNIILNFWATWCGPCRYEIPILQNYLSENYDLDVKVIAICTQDNDQNVSDYAKAKKLSFVIPLDTLGKVARMYGVSGLPTTFFIDRDGVITSVKIGPFISQSELTERVSVME